MERERPSDRIDAGASSVSGSTLVAPMAVSDGPGAAVDDAELVDASLMPLIVWLRGDEPWCSQFSLDAEAVMARLSIRRSRLTQISGKELRVGRIRRGRHVVPVYREADVESYLSWARAPATHMKSATALQEATTALEKRGEELAAVAAEAPGKVAEAVELRVRDALRGTTRVLVESVATIGAEIKALSTDVAAAQLETRRDRTMLSERLARLESAAEKLAIAAMSQAQDLTELAALARLQAETERERIAADAEVTRIAAERWATLDLKLEALTKLAEQAASPEHPAPPKAQRNVADVQRLMRLAAKASTTIAFAQVSDAQRSPAASRRRTLRGPRRRPRP